MSNIDPATAWQIVRMIDALRSEEGSWVTIHADNAEFNGMPDYCIEVGSYYTDYESKTFYGSSVLDALTKAVEAYSQSKGSK